MDLSTLSPQMLQYMLSQGANLNGLSQMGVNLQDPALMSGLQDAAAKAVTQGEATKMMGLLGQGGKMLQMGQPDEQAQQQAMAQLQQQMSMTQGYKPQMQQGGLGQYGNLLKMMGSSGMGGAFGAMPQGLLGR